MSAMGGLTGAEVQAVGLIAVSVTMAVLIGSGGLINLIEHERHAQALRAYGLTWYGPVGAVANRGTAAIELAIGIGLLLAPTLVLSAAAALVVIGAYGVAMAVELLRGRTHDCGCGGVLGNRDLSWALIARNGILVLLAAGIIICSWTHPNSDALIPAILRHPLVTLVALISASSLTLLVRAAPLTPQFVKTLIQLLATRSFIREDTT